MRSSDRQRATGGETPPTVRLSVILIAVALSVPAAGLIALLENQFSVGNGNIETGAREWSFNGDGPINVTLEGVALKGFDAVAYHVERKAVKGKPEYTATYEDATFRFASEKNRQLFLKDPGSYVPAYGGYCALGVSHGYKDDMHPQAFDIVDGRLYFNLSPAISEHWRRDKEGFIDQADAHWPEIKDAPGHGPADMS